MRLAVVRQVVRVHRRDVQEEPRRAVLPAAWRLRVGERSPVEIEVVDEAGDRLLPRERLVGGAKRRARVMLPIDPEHDAVRRIRRDLQPGRRAQVGGVVVQRSPDAVEPDDAGADGRGSGPAGDCIQTGNQPRIRAARRVKRQGIDMVRVDIPLQRLVPEVGDGFGMRPARLPVSPYVPPRYPVGVGLAYGDDVQGEREAKPHPKRRRRSPRKREANGDAPHGERPPAAYPLSYEIV